MQFKRIKYQDSQDFKDILKIYESSFPADERRHLKEHIKLFANPLYSLIAVYMEKKLVAFLSKWEFDDFVFLEHFAVREELRCQGIGTAILKSIISKGKKEFIIEIQHPETIDAKRRIKFYRRNGFKVNKHHYIQPPYAKDKKPVNLLIISYPEEISEPMFSEVRKTLHKQVYGLEEPLI